MQSLEIGVLKVSHPFTQQADARLYGWVMYIPMIVSSKVAGLSVAHLTAIIADMRTTLLQEFDCDR